MKPLYFSLLILFIFTACNNKAPVQEEEIVVKDSVAVVLNLEYNLPVDSFLVSKGRIKRNQFLSNILNGYGISAQTIDTIARHFKDSFDVRKIRVGNPYTVFQSKDSIPRLNYFVYEKSLWEYIVYDFRRGITLSTGKKPVKKEVKTAKGIINSSLWNTMIDNNINPMLAIELSDIYAWSIDFFGIAAGDKFRVVYEEQFADSLSIGISRVIAAEFHHLNTAYYAIPFNQDSITSFYDLEGNSLKKAFLKAPLKYSRISSGYSLRRYHPVLKYYRPHQGVDYAAPTGTPVQTIGDGTITRRGYQKGGGGNYLYIKHNSVYTTVYMHLNKFANGMNVGRRVSQGEVIGYVGATGIATGPHLDFRVYMNGKLVNPLRVKAPPVKPVVEENMNMFEIEKANTLNILNAIEW